MQNLTECGVVELNEMEMQDIDGGWVAIAIRVAIAAAALLYSTPAN